MSREFFYTTGPRYFWTQLPNLPSGHRKFEGQNHPHFWGGEIELWRHESAFPWSYGTNSHRVRFPAFQPRKAFFRPLASFTGLFWYKCHLPNIQKRPNMALASIPSWQTIGDVKWRPSPKGAVEESRSRCGPGQHPGLGGSIQTPNTSAVPDVRPSTGDKQERLAPPPGIGLPSEALDNTVGK